MNKIFFLSFCLFVTNLQAQSLKDLTPIFGNNLIQLSPSHISNNSVGAFKQYPSSTVKGEITGISNDLEYLSSIDESMGAMTSVSLKFLRTDWVTNKEYNQFCEWVVDSIFREAIHRNIDPAGNRAIADWEIERLLLSEKYYTNVRGEDSAYFDPSLTDYNRQRYSFDYNFNWRKKISSGQTIPILSTFYKSEQFGIYFFEWKLSDERMWFFKRNRLDQNPILISRDRQNWAQNSDHPFDYHYNLANHYYKDELYENFPVQGVLGNQAEAYLAYLEDKLQKEIDARELNYRVRLTLPHNSELYESYPNYIDEKLEFTIAEKDMTSHWQITNKEYKIFLNTVTDSLIRELLYHNTTSTNSKPIDEKNIASLLKHPAVFYDQANLEWREFDPSEPLPNRGLFPFDYNFKWHKKIAPEVYIPLLSPLFNNDLEMELDLNNITKTKYRYTYHWQDLKRMADAGNFEWNENNDIYEVNDSTNWHWNVREKDMGHGMRRTMNYEKFAITETLNVYPQINCVSCNKICEHDHKSASESTQHSIQLCPDSLINVVTYDFKSNPKDLVEGLTYEQALAFYYWKFLSSNHQIDFKEIIYNELLPTEEEFNQVQAGKRIIKSSQMIPYPSPLFRYVIHLYKK